MSAPVATPAHVHPPLRAASRFGTTTDPAHGLTVADLTRVGFSFGRIVFRWSQDPTVFLQDCAVHGIPLIGIWTGESRAPGADDRSSAMMWFGWLLRTGLLPVIRWLQIGNEPDLVSDSSWTMSHDEFNAMVGAVAPVFAEHCIIIAGGLASGNPAWLAGVDQSLLDVIACFVPDQRVTATRPTHAWMRRYQGDVITIKTALGNQMTCTPNHPVLTRQGWLPAREIHEGTQVAQRPVGDHAHAWSSSHPDDVEMPTPIGEVFRTLHKTGMLRGRPGGCLDFHGDGQNGDVDVVTSDRLLRDPFAQTGEQIHLPAADLLGPVPLFAQGLLRSRLLGERTRERGGVQTLATLTRDRDFLRSLETKLLRRGARARRQATAGEEHVQAAIAHADLPRQSHHRFPGQMAGMQRMDIGVGQSMRADQGATAQGESARLQRRTQPGSAFPERGGDRLDTLARQVAFVDVVEVGVSQRDTHVYNLSTADGLIVADGILTHNCHPYGQKPNADPIWTANLPEWANEVDWFLDLYRAYTTLPLCVTEYGARSNEMGDLTRRYCQEMTQTLLGLCGNGQLGFACIFCLSELMVPGFGMLDDLGRLTPAGRGVRSLT
jgi:hypothetical protein